MGSKRAVLLLSAIFIVVFSALSTNSSAQRMKMRHGSVYVGVGYSKAWFFPSTIHIQQGELGNDYKMVKVKAGNLSNTSLSLWQLSYRIGYYYNFQQTWGVELNFDPANYNVKEGGIVRIKGTVNNVANVDKKITFTAKNGYYYYYNGANLILLNLVRRVTLIKNNANSIRLDAIGKVGAGPVMPHFVNNLGSSPVAGPQFKFAGINAGVEVALRGTFYRYFYLEVAGKYDFAYMNNLPVYEGTARHNLQTYEAIATVGFTFPTTKNNPLFRKEKKIITILPFYQQAKQLREGSGEDGDGKDSTDHNKFKEIAPFDDILEKEAEEAAAYELKMHPPDTFNNMDSIAAVEAQRVADSTVMADNLFRQDSADHVYDSLNSKKERKRRKREQADSIAAAQKVIQDSIKLEKAKEIEANKANNADGVPAADSTGTKPPEPAEENKPSKKEEKKKAKEEKKEAKKREKEAAEEAKRKAKEEAEAKKAKEEEERAKKEEEDKPKEDAPPEPPKDGN